MKFTHYQTTTSDTERLMYHATKFHRKILMTATIINKTLKNPKMSDFEIVTLFLNLF